MTTRARVMTFNVRYDTENDGEDAWDRRQELVASVVRFHQPDVVGLQEPLVHQLADLREALPDYRFVGRARLDGADEGEYCPLGYRHERFALREHGTEWLSETPTEPGTSYPGAKKPRITTWGRFVDSEGGDERASDGKLVVCNTHFDHESASARVRSARQVRRLADSLTGSAPVVLLGDFNCTRGSRPYGIIVGDESDEGGDADGPDTEAGIDAPPLDDAMATSDHPHHGPTVTFERFGGDPDRKIDHVFVSNVDVRQHGVLADHWDGRVPSDHSPVLAEIEYR